MTGSRPETTPRVECAWPLVTLVLSNLPWIGYQAARWPDIAALKDHAPETTAFIEAYKESQRQQGQGFAVQWQPVPWERISPHLKRAVVSAEDMEFFFRRGFSSAELHHALQEALRRLEAPRGASTITQQLAKNLWLSPSRNPFRKLKEAILTWQLERDLTKQRILELYLNVVEFGPAIYGAEAAARGYFGKPAADLTEHEAAELAASLPRPSAWHPGRDSEAYQRYVAEIEQRMARAGFLARYVGGAPAVGEPPPVAINLDSILKLVADTPWLRADTDTNTTR
jgi:monofunctional biosynthetic peptidoglycan transglycosylase